MNYNIGEEFCRIYYNKNVYGVNNTFDLYHPDVVCSIENETIQGAYNLLIKLTSLGIARFEYYDISGCSQITNLNNGDILISVNGSLKYFNLWGVSSYWMKFNEIFVLGNFGGRYFIKNYVIKIL